MIILCISHVKSVTEISPYQTTNGTKTIHTLPYVSNK